MLPVIIITLAVFFGLLILNILFKTAKFIFKLVFLLILLAIVVPLALMLIFDVSIIGIITGIFGVVLLL